MSITVDGRGVRWDWFVPAGLTRAAEVAVTDGTDPVAVSSVVGEVWASGVKLDDGFTVAHGAAGVFTITTPTLSQGVYRWRLTVDGTEFGTGDFRVVAAGDPRASAPVQDVAFVVGEELSVAVTVLGGGAGGDGSGDVVATGSPSATEYARWTNATTIEGRTPAQVRSDVDAEQAGTAAAAVSIHNDLGVAAHGGIVADNDARLSDARTPTAHAGTHATGGSDSITPADIGAATSAQGSLADSAVQPGDLGGSASLDVGTTTGTVAAGDDARLSDAREPTAHAATHATGQPDAVAPADIGAATEAQGALADTALQPADVGTAAAADTGDFATAVQGATADTAVQPGDLATVATTGAYADVTGTPTLGTMAAESTVDYDTSAEAASQYATLLRPIVTVSTTTHTFLAADVGKLHRFTHADGCTVTVPNEAVGSEWFGVQRAAGAVTLAEGTGLTLTAVPSGETEDVGSQFVVTIDDAGTAIASGRMVES